MKTVGLGLLIIGYALLYAGLSEISTGGKGYGFLKALGFKGATDINANTQSFIQSIVPGGSVNSGTSTGGGSVQQANSPVQSTTKLPGVTQV